MRTDNAKAAPRRRTMSLGFSTRLVRNSPGAPFFAGPLRVTDHRGALLVEFDDNQTGVDFSGLVVAGGDPVNERVRYKTTFLLYPAPFHDVIGLLGKRSATGFHGGRIQSTVVFPKRRLIQLRSSPAR